MSIDTTTEETGSQRRRALPRWKKALLGLAVTCLFFAALELALAIGGVRPMLYDEDPFVGFAASIPLFVEHTTPDGQAVWRTAHNKRHSFNLQQFPRTKARGTIRIFCLGGSTTYGRPFDDATSFCGWLRELLPAADPSRKWELVNAGGLSYASYRVAALTEELVRREPDLFVVYCGHNEFLERRTYRKALHTPGPLRRAAAAVGRTRTGTALRWLLRRTGALPAKPPKPDPGRDVLPGEVQAILDHAVGPTDYARDDAWARRVVDHYRVNLGRIVDIARSAGVPIVLVTPAANLKDCSPFKSEHRAGLADADKQRWHALVEQAEAAADPAEALAALDRAAAIDDRYAALHYRRGQALLRLGRHAEAKAAFERAIVEDICPLRALPSMRRIVADVAAQRHVPLVDFARMVAEQAEHDIPGRKQFLDHVHPTIRMHRLLALALVDALTGRGIVRPAPSWGEAAIERVTQRVEGRVGREAMGVALRNLSKVMGWAGKFAESRSLALDALEFLGDDAESLFQVGAYSHVLGDADQALAYLRKAVEVKAHYGPAHFWLGEALARQGDLDQAIRHYTRAVDLMPDDAKARTRLAEALAARKAEPVQGKEP